MSSFEYEITSHPKVVLQKQDSCDRQPVPAHGPPAGHCTFIDILDERGRQGWEFVHLFFSDTGINACWKRKKQACEE